LISWLITLKNCGEYRSIDLFRLLLLKI